MQLPSFFFWWNAITKLNEGDEQFLTSLPNIIDKEIDKKKKEILPSDLNLERSYILLLTTKAINNGLINKINVNKNFPKTKNFHDISQRIKVVVYSQFSNITLLTQLSLSGVSMHDVMIMIHD